MPASGADSACMRVEQTRAGRGGGTHRRDRRRGKGPKVSVMTVQISSTCMVNSPIRFMWGYPDPAAPGRPSRCWSDGVGAADRFHTPLLEPEDLYAQLARQKLHGWHRHAKAAERPHACAPPSLAGRVSMRLAGQSMAWGKRGRAKLAGIYHGGINSNLRIKIIGHVPVLLSDHFD